MFKYTFKFTKRSIVKKLAFLSYESKKAMVYKTEGVPYNEFRKELLYEVLGNKPSDKDFTQGEIVVYRKLDFEIGGCIERNFIKQDEDNLRITQKGAELISPCYSYYYFYIFKNNPAFLISLLSLLISAILTWVNVSQVASMKEKTSFDFLIQINNNLSRREYAGIYDLITYNNNKISIFKSFATSTIDDFIDEHESLASLYDKKLIDMDLLCGWFGMSIKHINENIELNEYLQTQYALGYYLGFENISADLKTSECF